MMTKDIMKYKCPEVIDLDDLDPMEVEFMRNMGGSFKSGWLVNGRLQMGDPAPPPGPPVSPAHPSRPWGGRGKGVGGWEKGAGVPGAVRPGPGGVRGGR